MDPGQFQQSTESADAAQDDDVVDAEFTEVDEDKKS